MGYSAYIIISEACWSYELSLEFPIKQHLKNSKICMFSFSTFFQIISRNQFQRPANHTARKTQHSLSWYQFFVSDFLSPWKMLKKQLTRRKNLFWYLMWQSLSLQSLVQPFWAWWYRESWRICMVGQTWSREKRQEGPRARHGLQGYDLLWPNFSGQVQLTKFRGTPKITPSMGDQIFNLWDFGGTL